jgi:hypothetical protein
LADFVLRIPAKFTVGTSLEPFSDSFIESFSEVSKKICCPTHAPAVRISYCALRAPWLEAMRVLFAMQEDHRVYREVMAGSLRAMRPCLEVATAGPTEFEERLESFKPQVVICGGRSFARREWAIA